MSEKNPVDLSPGDSAVVIRHEEGDDAGFGIEIYHHPLTNMDEEDLIFYTLLTRGMAFQATIDTETVLEFGEESLTDDKNVTLTEH
tara:strand:+ start:2398 stop:2655 length:258 start_codon:yes stop_codon:yes gene_type:complete